MWTLAQVDPTSGDFFGPQFWTQLGVGSVVVVILLAVIRWLLKQLDARDAKIEALTTRLLDMTPLLAETNKIIERMHREQDR